MMHKSIPMRYKIVDAIRDNFGGIFLAISSVFGLIVGIAPEHKICEIPMRIPFMFIAIVSFLVGTAGEFQNKKSLRETEIEKDRLKEVNDQYYDDVNRFLRVVTMHLASDCNLIREGENRGFLPEVRLTIYCHHKTKSIFWPLIRFAGNPKYQEYRHHDYPDNVGAISQCWENGDYGLQTNAEGETWVKEMIAGHYIPEQEIASKIRMQAKSLSAIRLSKENEYLGVLVIESTKKTVERLAYLPKIEKSIWFPILIDLILTLRDSHIKMSEESEES